MTGRYMRVLAVVASAAMILGALVAPADAKKKKKKKKKKDKVTCQAYTPAEPISDSHETAEALDAEVIKLTEKHTEEAPLVVEYEHGAALWFMVNPTDPLGGQAPAQEDTVFFNVQNYGKNPSAGIYARIDWPAPSPSDMDLYMYDVTGTQVAASGASNQAPLPVFGFDAGGRGGNGFESITGHPSPQCSGFTFESRAFATSGESMTLTLWLGDEIPVE